MQEVRVLCETGLGTNPRMNHAWEFEIDLPNRRRARENNASSF